MRFSAIGRSAALVSSVLLSACGGGGGGGDVTTTTVSTPSSTPTAPATPPPTSTTPSAPTAPAQLSAAVPGTRQQCESLQQFVMTEATVLSASMTDASLGVPVCLVTVKLNKRQGVTGTYAIQFHMVLPTAWDGRLYFNASSAPPTVYSGNTALVGTNFFAVNLAPDGEAQPPSLGLDPVARQEFATDAIGKIVPVARKLMQVAYGRPQDRSYIGGCFDSGGSRALLAASRYASDFDGILAGAPSLAAPKAGIQWAWSAQQMGTLATVNGYADPSTALTSVERDFLRGRILAKCDALDGATDGMVLDVAACQSAFSIQADVPTCASNAARNGSCLTAAQKAVLTNIMGGARNSAGTQLYTSFPWDRGSAFYPELVTQNALELVPYHYMTPPVQVTDTTIRPYIMNFSMDTDAPKIFATSATYPTSAMQNWSLADATALDALRNRGGKILVYHGTADSEISVNESTAWYDALHAKDATADQYARVFPVPGMLHCSGGPATDQFDALTPLIAWVEQGKAPESIKASLAPVDPCGPPPAFSPYDGRSRPLCPYPKVARLKTGATDLLSASSFECK